MPHIPRVLPDGSTAVYIWFEAMHTRVDLLLRSDSLNERDLLEAADGMRGVIAMLEKAGNRFDPQSELWRLNHFPAGEETETSEVLFDMLSQCLHYNRKTNGLFDISVSSPSFRPGFLKKIHLGEGGKFYRDSEDVMLDLSGFIKGYALDRLREYLETQNITDALVNLGNSSIMAIGDVPGPVRNGCLTTSGNGKISRNHIRNPLTGDYITATGEIQVFTQGGAEGEVEATVKFIKNNNTERL